MKPTELVFKASDGTQISYYKWMPQSPKAVVQIAHGAIEHAMRYDEFANALAAQGFAVYADDHRGHGNTAGSMENMPYFSDQRGGFSAAVDDLHTLTKLIQTENEGLPVILLGHSMGSAMSRIYVSRFGKELKGLVLTGTGRVMALLILIVRLLAKCQMILLGRRHRSPLLHSLAFGTLNRPFKGETGSEFICSDQAVIDAYVADEYCGNISTCEFIYELLWGIGQAAKKKTFENTPKDLPVLIASGEFDAMGGAKLAAVGRDVADYEKAGIADLTFKTYDGMRHEILNEIDRKTVYNDIICWIEAHL